ncbi:Transporter, major facilitator family [Pseudomonas amygdali pv. ciccaronei]|nr:Transporter, major facilitator family [Pseudomonas amygdali pv. ciccaronei]
MAESVFMSLPSQGSTLSDLKSDGRARSHLGFLAFTTLCFFAASSTPTPLYHLYQEAWGFSSGVLTLIFAVYAFSLLAALLIGGSLSDYLGRRPVIFGANRFDVAVHFCQRC